MTVSAIIFWTKGTDPASAGPGDAERLDSLDLHQRVVRVRGRDREWVDVQYGLQSFRVRETCLRPVTALAIDVGDTVDLADGPAVVRDIIWHFKAEVPNYYLSRDGKNLSKRYLAGDLTRLG